jgi:hypothetical protein
LVRPNPSHAGDIFNAFGMGRSLRQEHEENGCDAAREKGREGHWFISLNKGINQ